MSFNVSSGDQRSYGAAGAAGRGGARPGQTRGYQAGGAAGPAAPAGLMMSEGEANVEYAQLKSRVIDDLHQLDAQLKIMTTLVQTVEKKKDNPKTLTDFQASTERTKALSHESSAALRRMIGLPCSDVVATERRMAHQKIGADLKSRLEVFQRLQERARACDKLVISAAQKKATLPDGGGAAIHSSHVGDSDADLRVGLLDQERERQFQQVNAEVAFNDEIIAERERDIREIESNLIEVNGIFRDLAEIVAGQGEMLGQVEGHIESTVANTGKAADELRKANDYQKSARSKMCCLAMVAVIVACAIMVPLLYKSKN